MKVFLINTVIREIVIITALLIRFLIQFIKLNLKRDYNLNTIMTDEWNVLSHFHK